MAKAGRPQPTEADLEILRVLWQRGPSTVREVYRELGGDARKTYTGVLKQLQVMHGKGLVNRDETGVAHVYRSSIGRESAEKGMIRSFLERRFGGTAHQLVVKVLSSYKLTPEELDEIHRVIEGMRK